MFRRACTATLAELVMLAAHVLGRETLDAPLKGAVNEGAKSTREQKATPGLP